MDTLGTRKRQFYNKKNTFIYIKSIDTSRFKVVVKFKLKIYCMRFLNFWNSFYFKINLLMINKRFFINKYKYEAFRIRVPQVHFLHFWNVSSYSFSLYVIFSFDENLLLTFLGNHYGQDPNTVEKNWSKAVQENNCLNLDQKWTWSSSVLNVSYMEWTWLKI